MTNNEVMKSVRYMLSLNDKNIVEIINLADHEIQQQDIQNYMRSETDPEYIACSDIVMSKFLDGLIYFKRGRDPSKPPMPYEFPITNNTILKKLRVAFELKEEDLIQVIAKADFRIGKSELSAFSRKKDHPNYRNCGDQVMRYFLKGLVLKFK